MCWNTLFFGQNQKIVATKIDSIEFVTKNFIGIDSYGNYFYENKNVLYKKTPTSTIQYQNVSLGKIKKVDIINTVLPKVQGSIKINKVVEKYTGEVVNEGVYKFVLKDEDGNYIYEKDGKIVKSSEFIKEALIVINAGERKQ